MTANLPQISAALHPLHQSTVVEVGRVGQTVAECVADLAAKHQVKDWYQQYVYVEINGKPLLSELYDATLIGVNQHIVIQYRVPMGGGGDKNPLGIVLSLVVVAASIAAPALLPSTFALDYGIAAYNLAAGGLSAAVMMGGMALVGAIVPAPQMSSTGLGHSSLDTSSVYSISGMRNYAPNYKALPMVLGRMRYSPPYGANPYTRINGNDQYLHCDFVWGAGPLDISDIKIGDTSIDKYDEVTISTNEGYDTDSELELYPNDVYEYSVSAVLAYGSPVTKSTQEDTELISIDLVFTSGLFALNDKGTRINTSVNIVASYRKYGITEWTVGWSGAYTAKTNLPLRKNLQFDVSLLPGEYEVKIERTTADKDESNDKLYNEVAWSVLRSIKYQDPVTFDIPIAETQLVIKATDQLSGVIDNLNGIAETVCLDYDYSTDTWIERATNNPASLVRHVYQGPGQAKPRADSKIDISMLEEWHDFCRLNEFTYNYVHDAQRSVTEVVNDICHAGRATRVELGDVISVAIDRPSTTGAVQMFTPSNSRNFSSKRTFREPLHGYRVAFNNEDADFVEDEVTVYAEGYSASNATLIEALEFRGVTNSTQAEKLAKYHLAVRRYRPEVFTWETDWEALVCSRGDLVKVASPAILVGQESGRIRSFDTLAKTITLDQDVTFSETSYFLTLRTTPDEETQSVVTAIQVTETAEANVVNYGTETLPDIAAGDIYTFGTPLDVIITSKRPGKDLTAVVTGVPYSWDEITAYLAGSYPDYDSGVTLPIYTSPYVPLPPTIISIVGGHSAAVTLADGTVRSRIILMVRLASGGKVPAKSIQAELRQEEGWIRSANTDPNQPCYWWDVEDGDAEIRVRSVSADGRVSSWVYDSYTQVSPNPVPDTVTSLTVTGQLFVNHVEWTLPDSYRENWRIEIWCASGVNDRGNAMRVAVLSGGTEWQHTGLDPDITYYYWARITDDKGQVSDWYPDNEYGGVEESPIQDPELILGMLTESITSGQLSADLNTALDGALSWQELTDNEWTVKIDDNGYMVGLGAISYPDWESGTPYLAGSYVWHPGTEEVYIATVDHVASAANEPPHVSYWSLIAYGAKSQVIIQADQFAIVNATGGGSIVPFVINGTTAGFDGQVVVDGTVTADKLTAHDTITWTIKSQNYSAGSAGFIINALTGFAEFNNFTMSFNDLSDKPTSLNNINTTEYSKLSGVSWGADVTANVDLAAQINANSTQITGTKITTPYLSTIQANIGTCTAGIIRSSNSQRYVNLNASSTGRFIQVRNDSSVDTFWVDCAGNAYFAGTLKAGTVVTDSIQGNAVTEHSSAYYAGGASSTTLMSLSIYVAGDGKVLVNFHEYFNGGEVSSENHLYLKRNGTTISTVEIQPKSDVVIMYTDSPGTGTHTYTIVSEATGGLSYHIYRNLSLVSFKK